MSVITTSKWAAETLPVLQAQLADLKSDYRAGRFGRLAGMRGPVIVDEKGGPITRVKQTFALRHAANQAAETLQIQILALQACKGKSKDQLNKMFEDALKPLCPYCKGGIATGEPHCKRGRDVAAWWFAFTLFRAVTRYEVAG